MANDELANITFNLSLSTAIQLTLSPFPSTTSKNELLKLLFDEERRHPQEGKKPNTLRIAHSRSFPLLKMLVATGKLYFNNQKLIADLFGRINVAYHVSSSDNKKFCVRAVCTTAREEFDLSSCDFISPGPPVWYIRGSLLKVIAQHMTAKEIGLMKSPLLLSQSELTDFIEEHTNPDDPELPKVVYAEGSQNLSKEKLQPFPQLVLQDRMGAFATLFMNYGDSMIVPFHEPMTGIKGKRELEEEKGWERDLLETDFQRKQVDKSHYYCPVDKVAKSLTFLLECRWTIIDSRGNQVKQQGEATLFAEEGAQKILIKGKVRYAAFEADLKDVVGAFNRRERFVQLGQGTVGLLPDRLDNSLGKLVEEGELVQEGIRVNKNRMAALGDVWNSSSMTADLSLIDLKERLRDFHSLQVTPPGPDFKGTLRPYQQEGVNWLSFLYDYGFHGLLADDMGLGKTVQVLAFLSRLPQNKPILIVVPTSLLFNWKQEIHAFLGCPAAIHHGPDRTQSAKDLSQCRFILTSYTTLRIDLALFKEMSFQCMILDEAQAIKNPSAQITQAAYQIDSQFRLSMSGTPVENRLEELWSQFHFLMPDLLGKSEQFAAETQSATVDSRYLQSIRQKIRPFLLRRKKEDVAKELPERIEQVVWVEMSEEQKDFYEQFLAGARSSLLQKVEIDGIGKHRIEVLELILRLRQICCHPHLIGSLIEQGQKMPSAKMDMVLQDIETIVSEGHKVLVYSQFTSMLHLLEREVKQRGWRYVSLDGSTTNRAEVVRQFQEEESISLFLISLKAGGSGLNLTSADYVFLYDPWWNAAVENQAIDRAHRIGREGAVIAKRYVVAESIEEKMMTLKANKSSLVDDLFDSESLATSLSIDDLRYLLS